jgi:hypothetical protein
MTRRVGVALGLATGALIALLLILVIGVWRQHRAEQEQVVPQAGPNDSRGTPDNAQYRLVAIYQRALTSDVRLKSVESQIVWLPSVTQRARQIVRLVLEGFPAETDTVAPAPPGVRCRELFADQRSTLWVDLDSDSLRSIQGSDQEEALVATLARSVVDALPEIKRVGFLVDGKPRETLAGHVDVMRRYSGREWPLEHDKEGEP